MSKKAKKNNKKQTGKRESTKRREVGDIIERFKKLDDETKFVKGGGVDVLSEEDRQDLLKDDDGEKRFGVKGGNIMTPSEVKVKFKPMTEVQLDYWKEVSLGELQRRVGRVVATCGQAAVITELTGLNPHFSDKVMLQQLQERVKHVIKTCNSKFVIGILDGSRDVG